MLIIFDWDGTIIDSAGKIVSAMQQAALDCGLAVPESEAVRNIIGLGLPEAITELYPAISPEQQELLRLAYSDAFIAADQGQPCNFFPGVDTTLVSLKQRGHTLAVATGKSRRGLNRVFSHLSVAEYFSASRCADETRSKPDPLMLFELLEETGSSPADALMVGDTAFDLEMAQRAEIASVGVDYGAHPAERLRQYQPRAIISEFSALLELVN